MLPDEVVAIRMIENREAPRIPESDQVRFAGVEAYVHNLQFNHLFLSNAGAIDALS